MDTRTPFKDARQFLDFFSLPLLSLMFFHPFAFDANCETHRAAEPRSALDKGNLPLRGNKHGERIRAGGGGSRIESLTERER